MRCARRTPSPARGSARSVPPRPGHPFAGTVAPGEAVRLFTGSVVPEGADAILIQENATAEDDLVTWSRNRRPRPPYPPPGQDFVPGDTSIPAGQRLNPRLIGLAAAGGPSLGSPCIAARASSFSAPGDEIALPGDPLPPGGVVSSNGSGPRRAGSRRWWRAGAAAGRAGPTGRDRRGSRCGARRGYAGHDGRGQRRRPRSRAGRRLPQRGLVLDFWRIAMRPGKPLMHGQPWRRADAGPARQSGLGPGLRDPFPASCDRSALPGLPGDPPRPSLCASARRLPANDNREDYVRASLLLREDGGWVALSLPDPGFRA